MNGRPVCVMLLLLCACGSQAPDPAPPPPAGMVRDSGTVGVTGVEGLVSVVLQHEGRPSVGITGALRDELRRLMGARVRVEGTPASGATGDAIEVSRYDVMEINGEKPWVGVLVQLENGWALDTEGLRLAIDRLPDPLAGREGVKIWIIGVHAFDRLFIQSYGIINPGG